MALKIRRSTRGVSPRDAAAAIVIKEAGAMVTDNREASQFELVVDGQTAVLTYERTPTSLVLLHTEVPLSLRGRHLGDALAKAAIDAAHAERLRLVVVCPFVKAYLRKQSHRDTTDSEGSDAG